jgi:chemotaxis-related protein WspB
MTTAAREQRTPLRIGLRVKGERYALAATRIVEIIPRVALRRVALAPVEVAGLFTYRGSVVPVVDLCLLLAGEACADRLSSRIVVVRLHGDGGERLIGLLAEGVGDVLADGAPEQPALRLAAAPFLGGVFHDAGELVQLIEPEQLLPEALLAVLGVAEAVAP